MIRRYTALALVVPMLGLGACGGSDSDSEATAGESEQDRGQVRLQECLREQGLDVGNGPGPGGGGGGGNRPSASDREKLQKALEGPCKKYRDEAFGDVSAEDRQEFEDAQTKFSACMRENGVDLPDFEPGGGGGPPPDIDRDDPKFQDAAEKCSDELPRGGPGGPGGPGGDGE